MDTKHAKVHTKSKSNLDFDKYKAGQGVYKAREGAYKEGPCVPKTGNGVTKSRPRLKLNKSPCVYGKARIKHGPDGF